MLVLAASGVSVAYTRRQALAAEAAASGVVLTLENGHHDEEHVLVQVGTDVAIGVSSWSATRDEYRRLR